MSCSFTSCSFTRRPLVCLFDSGIGGINLLEECVRIIPYCDYVYFADNYNVPYGNLPRERISSLVFSAFSRIAALNPAAAVVACNTVTAGYVSALREKYSFPIIGIEPALKQACRSGGRYLVLATRSTCSGRNFAALIKKYGQRAVVAPCKNLASDIEKNIFSDSLASLAERLPRGPFSSVVLGCTHYVFLRKAIENRYSCPVFDGMLGTANHLKDILGKFDHLWKKSGKITFIGGDTSKNKQVYEKFKHNNI